MANLPKFSEVEHTIHKGLGNIDKWYYKVNDTDAYFICLGTLVFSSRSHLFLLLPLKALDLTIKTAYAEEKWQAEFYEAGLQRLEEVVSLSLICYTVLSAIFLPV